MSAKNARPLAQLLLVDPEQSRILLAYHKNGEFEGVYTALLDNVNEQEEPHDAAVRIALELAGIHAQDLTLRAVLKFSSPAYETVDEYEYHSCNYHGTPREGERVRPEWFAFDQIPYDQMPADDAIWYPPFLEGRLQLGSFHFAADQQTLEHHSLEVVDSLDDIGS